MVVVAARELDAVQVFGDKFVMQQMGRGFVKIGPGQRDPEDIRMVEEAWAEADRAIQSGEWDLVILDEPMSGLDPLGRRDVRALILRLRDRGCTVFFSSHVLSDADLVAMIVLTSLSVIGLWRFRTWGWSMALILSGLILALDISWWFAGQPRYPGMFLNMVAVFYLNQRDVRAIYLPSSL